jgi:hypothetical protein
VPTRISPAIGLPVEPERHFRAPDENRAPDQIGILHHQVDRLLPGLRKRPLLEDRAAGADEVEEPFRVDVLLEKRAIRRRLVDIDLFDRDPLLIQVTPGILTGGSGGFRVEGRFGHQEIVK